VNGNPRQKYLLIALGVVLLVAAWRLAGPMLGFGGDDEATAPATTAKRPTDPEGDGGGASRRAAAAATHPGAHPGDRVAVLRMGDLDRAPHESTPGRDPWRFVDPPPPPPPPPPKPHVPTAAELQAAEEARRRAEEAARLAAIEAAKPKPPEFNYQYLGRFGPADRQLAVFSNGKAVFNKQEGEVIDNKFVVAHIGFESVDIRFVGFPDVPAKRVGVTPRRPSPVGGNPG
jgi:hypothetical protein